MPAPLAGRYTKRQWQQVKRQELKVLRRQFSEHVQLGCVFTPCYKELGKIGELIAICEEKMAVKNWTALRGQSEDEQNLG